MRRNRKKLTGAVALCALTALAIFCSPSRQEPYPAAGEVRIVRDSYGTPFIFALTEADAMYGLGYATAEDRVRRIYSNKLAALGRSTELDGPQALYLDVLVRSFRLGDEAQAVLEQMDAETLELLRSYAGGINAYIAEHRDELPDWIDSFEPADSVAISLFFNMLFPLLDMNQEAYASQQGSSSFAVAASRSASGYALLSMDPHVFFDSFLAWYEAHISTPELSAVGAMIPGMPIIVMGHNGRVAWGNTVNNADLADVYVLPLEPGSQSRYRCSEGTRELVEWEETFKVKTGEGYNEVFRTLRRTHLGPVIRQEEGRLYAGRVSGYRSPGFFRQSFARMRAGSVQESLEQFRTPGLSFLNHVVADSRGNIAYLFNALAPRRSRELDWSAPVPGDDESSQWSGLVGFDELPKVINPECGWVQSSNGSPWHCCTDSGIDPEALPAGLVKHDIVTNRGVRLAELLAADDSVTFEEMIEISTDTLSLEARLWVPALAEAFSRHGADMELEGTDAERAVDLLAGWDFRCESSSAALTLFVQWYNANGIRAQPADQREDDQFMRRQLQALADAAEAVRDKFGGVEVPFDRAHWIERGDSRFPLAGASGLDTVRKVFGQGTSAGGFRILGGSSYQMVVEMSPTPRAASCLAMSASENEDSPHFGDQTELYSRKTHKPLWFTWEQLRPHVQSDVTLTIPR